MSKPSYTGLKYPIGTQVEVRMNGAWHPAAVYGQSSEYIIARADGYWYDEYAAEDVRPSAARPLGAQADGGQPRHHHTTGAREMTDITRTIQADGADHTVTTEAGDTGTITLDGRLDGSLTVVGDGDVHAIRTGDGV